jgi:folate-binding protein YgfZ
MNTETRNQYKSVSAGVGWRNLSGRGKLLVTGADRVRFLHSMISNDVEGLEDYQGRYGTFLTARGKMVADFYYYRLPQMVLMDVDFTLVERVRDALDAYIIMDDVELSLSDQFDHFSLQGLGTADLVQALLQSKVPARPLQVVETDRDGEPGLLVHKADVGVAGCEILLPRKTSPSFSRALSEWNGSFPVRNLDTDAWNLLRIEAGIPQFGVDMDQGNYPMEARLDSAISLTKGCYLGQEVVAKATHIGGVGRFLMGLVLDGEEPPEPGARVLSPEGKAIGSVTSAVVSPRLNGPIALGYVRRAFARPGQILGVELGHKRRAQARVVDRFRDAVA